MYWVNSPSVSMSWSCCSSSMVITGGGGEDGIDVSSVVVLLLAATPSVSAVGELGAVAVAFHMRKKLVSVPSLLQIPF